MCGIVGYLDKRGGPGAVGERLLAMLTALACRGPDSRGVAVWGPPSAGLRVHAAGFAPGRLPGALELLKPPVTTGTLVRLDVAGTDPVQLIRALEMAARDIELASVRPATFGVSRMRGSHGLGHTRLSTESRIDLSHSQSFWARGALDLAVVHNGHITNYHRLLRQYEQDGVRFVTENDSEVIGTYLAGKLRTGTRELESRGSSRGSMAAVLRPMADGNGRRQPTRNLAMYRTRLLPVAGWNIPGHVIEPAERRIHARWLVLEVTMSSTEVFGIVGYLGDADLSWLARFVVAGGRVLGSQPVCRGGHRARPGGPHTRVGGPRRQPRRAAPLSRAAAPSLPVASAAFRESAGVCPASEQHVRAWRPDQER
jgi:hypothetical protein